MKYISEEVLEKIVPRDESERRLLKFLIVTECQELDTLTVDRLRPMSEAPRDGRYIRVYWETGFPGEWCDDFVFWNERFEGWERDWVDPEDEVLQDRNFDGFIDVFCYEPENTK